MATAVTEEAFAKSGVGDDEPVTGAIGGETETAVLGVGGDDARKPIEASRRFLGDGHNH